MYMSVYENVCSMCNERHNESPEHVLMRCNSMHDLRLKHMRIIKSYMPPAMNISYEAMSIDERCKFMLSGFNCPYVSEWDYLYDAVIEFVWDMYKHRYISYTDMN